MRKEINSNGPIILFGVSLAAVFLCACGLFLWETVELLWLMATFFTLSGAAVLWWLMQQISTVWTLVAVIAGLVLLVIGVLTPDQVPAQFGVEVYYFASAALLLGCIFTTVEKLISK